MGGEEERGFVIRDRRARGEGGAPESSPQEPSRGRSAPSSLGGSPPEQAGEPTPPVSFSSFVFSLGTSALMLMGERLSPQQEAPPVNLAQAKEIIDILSILEGKTRGNLTSEEQSVLQDMLYALRMKYVDLASG